MICQSGVYFDNLAEGHKISVNIIQEQLILDNNVHQLFVVIDHSDYLDTKKKIPQSPVSGILSARFSKMDAMLLNCHAIYGAAEAV